MNVQIKISLCEFFRPFLKKKSLSLVWKIQENRSEMNLENSKEEITPPTGPQNYSPYSTIYSIARYKYFFYIFFGLFVLVLNGVENLLNGNLIMDFVFSENLKDYIFPTSEFKIFCYLKLKNMSSFILLQMKIMVQ